MPGQIPQIRAMRIEAMSLSVPDFPAGIRIGFRFRAAGVAAFFLARSNDDKRKSVLALLALPPGPTPPTSRSRSRRPWEGTLHVLLHPRATRRPSRRN